MEQTFEITITGMKNHTWQGHLRRGGEDIPFRSELELLLELDRLLPAPGPERAEAAERSPSGEGGAVQWRPT